MSNTVIVTFNNDEDANRFRRHLRVCAEVTVASVPGLPNIVDFIPARLEEDGS